MYKVIHDRRTVPDMYKKKLIAELIVSESEISDFEREYNNFLDSEFSQSDTFRDAWKPFEGNWSGLCQANDNQVTLWETGTLK